MIFDLLFLGFAIGALVTGYKNGLVKTLLRGVLFIVGGIAGMYFVVERNQSGWLICLLYTSPSPRDRQKSRMPSSA